jgi:hypothetical protein
MKPDLRFRTIRSAVRTSAAVATSRGSPRQDQAGQASTGDGSGNRCKSKVV